MILRFDDDIYTANADGGRLLANQAALAKTTVQIASLDGSNTRWTRLTEPCLLVVSRGKTVRLNGDEIDELIAACNANGEVAFGGGETPRYGPDSVTPSQSMRIRSTSESES